MAADINPGSPGSDPLFLSVYSDELYEEAARRVFPEIGDVVVHAEPTG